MRMLITLTAALVAGCTSTPTEIRESGSRHVVESKQLPRAAAHCLGRALENYTDGFAASIKDLDRADTYEIVVRLTVGTGRPAAVMEIVPAPGGALVTLWTSPYTPGDRFVKAVNNARC